MYSCLVEKKSLLCYPFENHVSFIQKDSHRRGRYIIPPGTRYLATSGIVGLPFTKLHSLGKCHHWSDIFCVFHEFVYYHHKQTVCKKTIGMARKFDFAADAGPDCDRRLSIIGGLRSTRTRGRIPIKQPCHRANNIWHHYSYHSFGRLSPSIC